MSAEETLVVGRGEPQGIQHPREDTLDVLAPDSVLTLDKPEYDDLVERLVRLEAKVDAMQDVFARLADMVEEVKAKGVMGLLKGGG